MISLIVAIISLIVSIYVFIKINNFKKSLSVEYKITENIVAYSIGNTAGLIMSKKNILKLVKLCLPHYGSLTNEYIDEQMIELESSKGFLVKASDVYSAIELEK